MLKFKYYFFTIVNLLLFPSLVLGQETNPQSSKGLRSIIEENYKSIASHAKLRTGTETDRLSPLDLFGLYFNIATAFAGILFIVQVIHGGFLWMTASGNEDQVSQARSKIINGTIGAGIVFSAYILVVFVLSQLATFVGIDEGGFNLGS